MSRNFSSWEDFLHIFQQIFWSKHLCPVVSLKASLFLLLAQAGESQTVFFCAHEKKGVPPNGEILFGAYFKGMNKKLFPSDVGDDFSIKNPWEMSGKRP